MSQLLRFPSAVQRDHSVDAWFSKQDDELRRFAGERLADYKVPRRVTFLAELPRNAGGKVLKSQLSAPVDSRER